MAVSGKQTKEIKIMHLLRDTFNNRTISKHRLLSGAVKADRSHSARIEKNNGRGSYIPTEIVKSNGQRLDHWELIEVSAIEFELGTK